jgi:DNA mismatch repair protein MutL
LLTRSAGDDSGWQIYAEGGVVRQAEAVGAPAGTVVEVRNLFFNTPARRKFLRRNETEFGHIADVVSRLAMARPDVHVRLSHDGRVHLEAFRHQHLEERVAALMSRSMAAEMLPIEIDSGAGEMLTGMLGLPALSRSNANHIYTYVNGRFVRDRVVQHAVLEAYRTLLERRRYPVVVLFLDIPPGQVDVNVHPTKHEVRFREQAHIHDFIQNGIRESLRRQLGHTDHPLSMHDSTMTVSPLPAGNLPEETSRPQRIQEAMSAYQQTAEVSIAPTFKGESLAWRRPHSQEPFAPLPEGWRLLGQYLGSYLVCQVGEDLVVVDQHAAHERVGFERLKSQFKASGVEQQDLLLPVVIDLDHRETASIREHLGQLARLGFAVDFFGDRTVAVKSVPQLLVDADIERLIRDVAGELAETGNAARLEEAFDHVLTVMACHGMVRANQPLSCSEMESLLRDMAKIDFGSHCPHGRPVIWRLNKSEVERKFHRR